MGRAECCGHALWLLTLLLLDSQVQKWEVGFPLLFRPSGATVIVFRDVWSAAVPLWQAC